MRTLNVPIQIPKGFYIGSDLLIELTSEAKVAQMYQDGEIVAGQKASSAYRNGRKTDAPDRVPVGYAELEA